jgi:hexokinase
MTLACEELLKLHPLPTRPSTADLQTMRSICQAVSSRAAAYIACGIHSLWELQKTHSTQAQQVPSQDNTPAITIVPVAYVGAILEKYPTFRDRCQAHIDALVTSSSKPTDQPTRLLLRETEDSSVTGGGVAALLRR